MPICGSASGAMSTKTYVNAGYAFNGIGRTLCFSRQTHKGCLFFEHIRAWKNDISVGRPLPPFVGCVLANARDFTREGPARLQARTLLDVSKRKQTSKCRASPRGQPAWGKSAASGPPGGQGAIPGANPLRPEGCGPRGRGVLPAPADGSKRVRGALHQRRQNGCIGAQSP